MPESTKFKKKFTIIYTIEDQVSSFVNKKIKNTGNKCDMYPVFWTLSFELNT